MKSIRASLTFAFGIFGLALLLGGCTVKWQVVQDPYANYHRIDQRVQIQLNQINSAVQNGSLWAPMAQVLSENDDMIRQLAWHYQGGQSVDLTPQQAAYLDSLLNDNGAAINDALTRGDQWAQAFEGNWDFSYATYQDRALYIAYLHYQLDRQQAMVDDASQSGALTSFQAQDLKTRILVIRNSETGCYDLNRRLDLTPNQIHRLQQMVDDNNRFIRFRTHHQRGHWNGDRFGGWSGQKKQYSNNPWLKNQPPNDGSNQGQTNGAHYWDGRPFQRQAPAPTATHIPYHVAVPTATPAPHRAVPPTATPIPHHVAAPTATPHPVAQARPTVVNIFQAAHPGHPNQPGRPITAGNPKKGGPAPGQLSNIFLLKPPTKVPTHAPAAAPASTPLPVAAAPTSTPVPAQPVTAPSTPSTSPDQSDNNGSSDNSGNGGHDHPQHPGHPDHPDNGGSNNNSQGSNQGN